MTSGQLTILIIVLAAISAGVVILFMRNRSRRLQSRFGPEYQRTLAETGSKLKAESKLEKIEKRVDKYSIRPLSVSERDRYVQEWRAIQTLFVDDPSRAFIEADHLLVQVMTVRGYPVSDFDNRVEEISVDHAPVVDNYRRGHEIALVHQQGIATTEQLRQGMIHYRALFGELVGDPGTPQAEIPRARAAGAN